MMTERDVRACGTWDAESIQFHPLYDKQVELERTMGRIGADQYVKQSLEVMRAGHLTRLRPIRRLLVQNLPGVKDQLVTIVRAFRATRGPKPVYLPQLTALPYETSCAIAMRLVLDRITHGDVVVTNLAASIGRHMEHECEVLLWEKHFPALFRAKKKELDRDRVTATHRANTNANRFAHFEREGVFKEKFTFEHWTRDTQLRVGLTMLSAIMRATGWFDFEDAISAAGPKVAPAKVIAANPALLSWFAKHQDREESMAASYMPCVIPPKRWVVNEETGVIEGGYWTPNVIRKPIVGFRAMQAAQVRKAHEEYAALDMPDEYHALDVLQETGWTVNRRVYHVAQALVQEDTRAAGLPLFGILDTPRRPWEGLSREQAKQWIKDHPKLHRKWRDEAKPVYRANAEAMAKQRTPTATLRVALSLMEEVFYFPHNLDFRSRKYPIPYALQPQGDDLARGLLQFREGQPVRDERGARWMAIRLAAACGNDKVSFDDMVAWVKEKEPEWRLAAAKPLQHRDVWINADKPFLALACIFEWVGYLEEGYEFMTYLPCTVDGTCNGLQHLSAMTRDHVAGTHVNLTPGEKPRDIYQHVADLLQAHLVRITEDSPGDRGKLARYWLDTLGWPPSPWSRKLTKRQVMVVPYGGTMQSFFDYTREWLSDYGAHLQSEGKWTWGDRDDKLTPAQAKRRHAKFVFLAQQMREAVNATVPGAIAVMEWLKACAKIASEGNQPIYWKLPTGFVVRHFYGAIASRKIETKLDGLRLQLRINEPTDRMDREAQLKGIAPNYVHSMDAAALTMTINRMAKRGITSFTAVHDAYGTHCCNMDILAAELREAFVELHSENVLEQYRMACVSTTATHLLATGQVKGIDPEAEPDVAWERACEMADAKLPRVPPMGDLDIREVLRSDYFFA